MEAIKFPTGNVTLVHTDLERSSELSERLGIAFEATRDEHFHLLRKYLQQWGGFEIETAGDSFFAVFANASAAVQFAVDVQHAFAQHQWPDEVGSLAVRIGIHSGEPFVRDDQGRLTYRGPVTNRTARIQAAGHGGQILISDVTHALTRNTLPPDIFLRSCGLHRLKGVGEEHLWQVCHPNLRHDFPALNSLQVGQVQLPLYLTPFMGREKDVAHLKEILADTPTRLILLLGPGGVGKTRLSVRIAEEAANQYASGVWFIELERANTQQEMFATLANRINVPLQINQTEEESVLTFLSSKNLLLVLDNVEQIAGVSTAISKIGQVAPDVKCLVSSREKLQIGGMCIFEVAPLPIPASPHLTAEHLLDIESVQFFVEQARLHQHNFQITNDTANDVAALCRQLGGLPLSLELAAAWVSELTPREILGEIRQRFDFLEVDFTNLPERQRTIRSSIDWSYNRLSPEEQHIFATVSIFTGGFVSEAAATVCQLTKPQMLVLLRKLHDKSLLTRYEVGQQTRFTMLQTILAYAGEKLAELPQIQQVAEAHAKYFTNFAVNFSREFQRRATNEVVRLRAFETDIDNVRTAMGWSEKSKKYEDVAHLSLALGLFLQQRGFQQEAQNRVETGLQAVQHSSADAIKVYSDLLCLRATLYLDKHQWAEAYKYASTALTSLDRLSQDDIEVRQGKGRTLNFLGLAATGDKQYGQARAYLTSALDCFNDTDDRTGLAIVRNNLGRIEHADVNGDKIAAEGHFQMALKLYRENADQRGLSEALTNLGVLAFDQGHLDQAWHFYKDALQLAQELQHPYGVGLTLCNLGEVAEQQGDFRRAYRLFSVAEHIFDQVASPYQQYALTAKQQVITRIEGRVPSDLQNEQYKEKPLEKLIDWALAPSGPVLQP